MGLIAALSRFDRYLLGQKLINHLDDRQPLILLVDLCRSGKEIRTNLIWPPGHEEGTILLIAQVANLKLITSVCIPQSGRATASPKALNYQDRKLGSGLFAIPTNTDYPPGSLASSGAGQKLLFLFLQHQRCRLVSRSWSGGRPTFASPQRRSR